MNLMPLLTGSVNTNEVVPIYAIVNSLVELPAVNKVQIAVNGETTKRYRELVSLDALFERNLDIILEEEKDKKTMYLYSGGICTWRDMRGGVYWCQPSVGSGDFGAFWQAFCGL